MSDNKNRPESEEIGYIDDEELMRIAGEQAERWEEVLKRLGDEDWEKNEG